MDTAYDLAEEYTRKYGVEKGIDRLITTQLAACGTSGFLAGVSGLILMPVAIPANVGSVLYIQMRMIATIAVMRGYDLKDDQIRTFVYIVLTGKAAGEVVRKAGCRRQVDFDTFCSFAFYTSAENNDFRFLIR